MLFLDLLTEKFTLVKIWSLLVKFTIFHLEMEITTFSHILDLFLYFLEFLPEIWHKSSLYLYKKNLGARFLILCPVLKKNNHFVHFYPKVRENR